MDAAGKIVSLLQSAGVRRLFGMPGGGGNADLVEAALHAGLPFTLAHTETSSAFMASAQAEITGIPGVCLATLGPGAASLMNGIANAYLDRIPLIALTDCIDPEQSGVMLHQAIDHGRIFAAVVKWTARPALGEISEILARALELAAAPPQGPVHLDLFGGEPVLPRALESFPYPPAAVSRSVLAASRRPVLLAGLGARAAVTCAAIRNTCKRLRIPALVTYKAKGVVPDHDPWFGGVFTNGALERHLLNRADLILIAGLDPVELLPRPWTLPQPVVSVVDWPVAQKHIPVAGFCPLEELAVESDWTAEEVCGLAERQRSLMRVTGDGLLPHRVAEILAESYPGSRATVDAGAHMFPVMSLWPAREPAGMLISNGLSTMGFALPAAIGAAFLDRPRPVVVFTGDGGLMMCLGELRTAARENLPLRIIVFDDGALSLIRLKQEQRGYDTGALSINGVDWRAVAGGMGMTAREAASDQELRDALSETATVAGPVLIAARINASVYPEVVRALRG